MKAIKYFTCLTALFTFHSTFSQSWFPLKIGNRWDYFIHIDGGALGETFDTLSVEIIGTEILANGLEYYFFSDTFPIADLYPKYVREENNQIFFFDEEDSTDCFMFRFDIFTDSSYTNCKNYLTLVEKSFVSVFGISDSLQHQTNYFCGYHFLKSFGMYLHYYSGPIVDYTYSLSGCIISGMIYGELLVSVNTENENSKVFSLHQNYPNPFNPSTRIKYSIPQSSEVVIKVFDMLGNEIETLVDEDKQAGDYETTWYAEKLASGIYFYRLQAGSYAEAKKMAYVK